jgi:putative membrane protein
MRIFRRKKHELWKGLVAGAAGGLVASWVMNQFQALWSRRTHGIERSHGAQSLQYGLPRHGVARELLERGEERESDNAAVRIARLVSEDVFGHRLAESEKETAGAVAHYAMGATSGAVYGAAAELLPPATAGAGLPFGAAVWLIADELIVPALGLSKPPAAYPLSTHAYALASHLVYGLSTEMMRRAVRRAL